MPQACASVSGLRTGNTKNWETWTDASFENMIFNADDDMARCNTQAKDNATIANNWMTPVASDSGRYNTPTLREDLIPRSKMAPERSGRGREEVKLGCFFDN